MGCSCRGGGRTIARSGARIVGYDYVPPGGGEAVRFVEKVEALVERRRRGGGTITPVTAG